MSPSPQNLIVMSAMNYEVVPNRLIHRAEVTWMKQPMVARTRFFNRTLALAVLVMQLLAF
ncbi:hypothetical protein Patl1_36362 [Pistacia atlantica]|nr:hypothetical protein Patl1_36362 [Pistacia atlantica]